MTERDALMLVSIFITVFCLQYTHICVRNGQRERNKHKDEKWNPTMHCTDACSRPDMQ